MGKYDDLFDGAPSPTPAVVGKYSDLFDEPGVVAVQQQPEGDGFLAKINAALRKPSPDWLQAPEQATRELVQGMLPHDLESYAAGIFPPLGAYEQGKALAQGDVSSIPFVGRIPEIAQAEETPAGSKERYLTAMKTIMDLGMLAGAGGERAPLRTEAPLEPPPVSPEIPPAPVAPDWFQAKGAAAPPPVEAPPVPPPPIGTPLKPVPLVGPNGETPALNVATAAATTEPQLRPGAVGTVRLYHGGAGEGAGTDFTPFREYAQGYADKTPGGKVWYVDVPEGKFLTHDEYGVPITGVKLPPEWMARAKPLEATPVIPPEDVKYAGGGPQTEVPGTVGISQARTEAELGPGSVEPGIGAEMGSGLEHGRNYVNKGGDPRLPIRRANTSGMVGKNDVGIVHAELDRLRVERNKAAAALEANPADPVLQQNFSVADDAQRAWRKELQPVLTKASDALREAHAASMPDADVSTYQGLADLMDEHFKGERTLSPEERTALAKAARGVKESRNIANGEMAKVEGTLEQQVRVRGKKMMSPEELEASIRNRLETDFTDCVLGA